MDLRFKQKNKTIIIQVSGEIDHHTSKELRRQTESILAQTGGRNIIFGFQDVTFMDSSGIGVMIGRYKQLQALGGRIAVLCPNGTVLTGDHKGIAMAENAKAVLLVNKDNAKKKVCWHGEFTSIIDAYESSDVAIQKDENGINFTIGEYAAYIIKK